jgi:hypothetical protein
MARPKKPLEQKRERHIGVRFDESEYAKIISEAKDIGVTLSGYVRAKTMKGYVRVSKYTMFDTALINQLSKLAGLLKQFYTATGGLHREETAAILRDIRALILKIGSQTGDDREVCKEAETQ